MGYHGQNDEDAVRVPSPHSSEYRKTSQRVGLEGWEYPPLYEALEAAVMCPMKDYVKLRQSTIEDYITILPI